MSLTGELAAYIVSAPGRPLPARALAATKHHLLDTVAAIVAGTQLPAGIAGADYARDHTTAGDATLIARAERAAPPYAALANAMAAHADEADDSHELSKSHPGCSIVPVALAIAESNGNSGSELLRAVALGYDVGPRVNLAAWPDFGDVRRERRGTPGISGTFGSAAAAAALRGLDERRVRYLLSYVAQQVSGMNTWKRDVEHIEKAFVLGGWPAFSALFALSVVEAGWSGVDDVFEGDPGFLEIVGKDPRPSRLTEDLGSRFEVERTHIKRFAVGSPAQAPVQGLVEILERESLRDPEIAEVTVVLPSVLAHTVQRGRAMANINLEYLLSTVIADGTLGFAAAHDEQRFQAWRDAGGDVRLRVVPDASMAPRRQAIVELATVDGRRFRTRIDAVRGSPENPMSGHEVRDKAVGLIAPVLGHERADAISDAIDGLDGTDRLDELLALLRRRQP